jgi:hypothetical protein
MTRSFERGMTADITENHSCNCRSGIEPLFENNILRNYNII